jgi:hypothetical protein
LEDIFESSQLQALFIDAKALKLHNRLFGGLLIFVGFGLFLPKETKRFD